MFIVLLISENLSNTIGYFWSTWICQHIPLAAERWLHPDARSLWKSLQLWSVRAKKTDSILERSEDRLTSWAPDRVPETIWGPWTTLRTTWHHPYNSCSYSHLGWFADSCSQLPPTSFSWMTNFVWRVRNKEGWLSQIALWSRIGTVGDKKERKLSNNTQQKKKIQWFLTLHFLKTYYIRFMSQLSEENVF